MVVALPHHHCCDATVTGVDSDSSFDHNIAAKSAAAAAFDKVQLNISTFVADFRDQLLRCLLKINV